ncbi:MAG: hypothetical protein ABH826_03540 [Patescibacteria group bacterium]
MEDYYIFEDGRSARLVEEPGYLGGAAGVVLGDQNLEPWVKENLYGEGRGVSGPMVHERSLRDRALSSMRRYDSLLDTDGQSVIPESDAMADTVAIVHESIEDFEDESDADLVPHGEQQLTLEELEDELSYLDYLTGLFEGHQEEIEEDEIEGDVGGDELLYIEEQDEPHFFQLETRHARSIARYNNRDGYSHNARTQSWKYGHHRAFQRHERNEASGRAFAQAWLEIELASTAVDDRNPKPSVREEFEGLRELRFRLEAKQLDRQLDLLEFWEFDWAAITEIRVSAEPCQLVI